MLSCLHGSYRFMAVIRNRIAFIEGFLYANTATSSAIGTRSRSSGSILFHLNSSLFCSTTVQNGLFSSAQSGRAIDGRNSRVIMRNRVVSLNKFDNMFPFHLFRLFSGRGERERKREGGKQKRIEQDPRRKEEMVKQKINQSR